MNDQFSGLHGKVVLPKISNFFEMFKSSRNIMSLFFISVYAALNQSVKHVGHKLLIYSDAIQTAPAFPGGKKVE